LLIPGLGALFPIKASGVLRTYVWSSVAFIMVAIIGLRHEVGADWETYLLHQYLISEISVIEAIGFGDPGYYVIGWLSEQLGAGVYGTNVVCGLILIVGIIRFIMQHPYPWVGMFISVPYLIIVVGMGYTRQSAALGFVLIALTEFQNERTRRYVLWIFVAVLFHKTAAVMLPIAGLIASKNRKTTFLWVGILTGFAGLQIISQNFDYLLSNYVETNRSSDGAAIRIAMNIIPALIFFVVRNQMGLSDHSKKLWFWMSAMACACLAIMPVSSTVADRLALYFIPVQLLVFSRVFICTSYSQLRAILVLVVMIFYALIQFVWFTRATHAYSWLPYQFAPL
jgi:hypothetical protein